MFSRRSYITWYHTVFGTNQKAAKALEYYGGFERLYEVVVKNADTGGLLSSFSPERLTSYSLVDAYEITKLCEDIGGEAIDFESPYYPAELKKIKNFPMVLFCQGDKEILREGLFVSVVGSREAPDDALAASYSAAYNMAKSGAVIVSGAALGVDSAAHKGALAAGGATVGVLGCGLGNEYMNRIGGFYDELCKSGVYITEMLPLSAPSKFSFPERNRIISGMSRAVLVTYAGEKSGSLITADTARKQKRRVYALSPDICASDGCRKLIESDSYVFHTAGDIIYPFREFCEGKIDDVRCNKPLDMQGLSAADYTVEKTQPRALMLKTDKPARKKTPAKEKPAPVQEKREDVTLPDYLSGDARAVYEALPDKKIDADSLVALTGLPVQGILAAISELEIFGFVKSLPGKAVEKI